MPVVCQATSQTRDPTPTLHSKPHMSQELEAGTNHTFRPPSLSHHLFGGISYRHLVWSRFGV